MNSHLLSHYQNKHCHSFNKKSSNIASFIKKTERTAEFKGQLPLAVEKITVTEVGKRKSGDVKSISNHKFWYEGTIAHPLAFQRYLNIMLKLYATEKDFILRDESEKRKMQSVNLSLNLQCYFCFNVDSWNSNSNPKYFIHFYKK